MGTMRDLSYKYYYSNLHLNYIYNKNLPRGYRGTIFL